MLMRSPVALTLVALVLTAMPLAAQLSGLPFEVGAAVYAPEAPVIDGDLSDDAWSRALPLEPFQTLTLHRPAEVQTTGYMLYDASTLYIGVRCEELQPERLKMTVDKKALVPREIECFASSGLLIKTLHFKEMTTFDATSVVHL